MKYKYKALGISVVFILILVFLFKTSSNSTLYLKDENSPHNPSHQSHRNASSRTVDRNATNKIDHAMQSESLSLSAEEFEYLWDEVFRLEKSPEGKETELSQLVIKMSKCGNAEYALKKVNGNIGEGKTRSRLIESIFSHIIDAETSGKLFSSVNANDLGAAVNGTKWLIARVLKESSEDGDTYDFNKFSFLRQNYDSVMSEAIEQYAYEMYSKDVGADGILSSIASLNIPENSKVASLVWLSSLDAFAVHEYLESNELKLSKNDQYTVVRRAKQGASCQVKDLMFQNLASRNYRVLQLC